MNFNIPLLIASLIYIILICFLYFSKNIQNNVENKIYKYLLIISLLGIILDISGIYAHMLLSETNIIRYLIVKFYMQYLLTFAYLITIYIIYVGKNSEKNKIIIKGSSYFIYLTVYLILSFFNFILPFEYYNSGNIVYIYGLNCTYLYAIVGINMIFWIIYVFKKRKQISKKKVLPIISFIVLSVPVILLQLYNPEFLLVTSLSAFVVVFMYHTIENPDVKMLEEFRIAKDRAEKANEEKELFLYNITQDIREPLKEITRASNWLNENTRNKNVIDATYYINKNASNITDLVNNVIDISTLELTNIKVYNTRYNINNIYKFIEKTYKGKKDL